MELLGDDWYEHGDWGLDIPSLVKSKNYESPRVLRRLLLLREWSHEEETESIYPSRSGASCTFGIRATAGTSIDVVDHRINRADDRMCATDLT